MHAFYKRIATKMYIYEPIFHQSRQNFRAAFVYKMHNRIRQIRPISHTIDKTIDMEMEILHSKIL